jgi:hypothetical protein
MMLRHKLIAGTKFEIRGRDAAWKRTLVVMTNLTLDPADEDYSAPAEAELLDAITAYWRDNPTLLDAVNVRSTREA